MTSKSEAKAKIAKAANGCEKAHAAWRNAYLALGGSVRTNGYGIDHDPYELRAKLHTAQAHINEALQELAAIEWPTDADYDLYD